ncbi:pyrimidine utilization protein D [Acinetobacter bouvetii]|uniref:Aminoacrylate hydrolase RutD n=1 Tax=Acinetobacter bouvetii TaxID=202951 RepID=A0A811GEM8_9GAMM|nr:pyrimidine utilization protein D [Acinetobacter bouvetii]CAB1216690.1 Putative aminoacrylate hydrolase RutD [Acinetobacter bouvetii]
MSFQIHRCTQHEEADYLVLASGLGGHASFWKPQIAALSGYFHVLAYDQEGCHADSAILPDPYSFGDMAKQLHEILKRESIHRFHFVGHAIGGFIGAELAILVNSTEFGLLSLTCINSWDELDPHTQKCFEARTELLKCSGAEAYVRAQGLFLYPPAWISKHHQHLKTLENIQLEDFPPHQNVLKRIQAAQLFKINDQHKRALQHSQLHFIANQDDFLVPVQKSTDLQQRLGHGQLSILASGAHASTVTETELLNSTILEFLQKHFAPEASLSGVTG